MIREFTYVYSGWGQLIHVMWVLMGRVYIQKSGSYFNEFHKILTFHMKSHRKSSFMDRGFSDIYISIWVFYSVSTWYVEYVLFLVFYVIYIYCQHFYYVLSCLFALGLENERMHIFKQKQISMIDLTLLSTDVCPVPILTIIKSRIIPANWNARITGL